jgi:hypothetical protein
MSNLTISLGLISDSTRDRVDLWLSWFVIGSCSLVVVLEWFLCLKRKVSLRRALLESFLYGFIIVGTVFFLPRK